MPQGANTNTNKANGTESNQEIEKKKKLHKNKDFQPFFKNTLNSSKTQNLRINLRKQREKSDQTYLREDFEKISLEFWLGF